MANAVNILDQGFACLVDNLGVIDAEYFISLIKRDDFDYTVWQREYFDKMAVGEFAVKASAYAESHPRWPPSIHGKSPGAVMRNLGRDSEFLLPNNLTLI